MHARIAIALFATAAAITGSGCASAPRSQPLADTWGTSARMAVEAQKLDPAPKGDAPVAGLDGVFAKNAMDAYRKSAEPDPTGGKDQLPDAIILTKKGAK